MGAITILGLGPGDFGLLTLETWDRLRSGQPLFLRTARHPVVAELDKRGIDYTTYDHEYETGQSFDDVYQAIANDVVRRADAGEPVLYAVPGSPLVAEKTVSLVRAMAADRGIDVAILPAMSFLETLYARLAIDPIAGITVVDAADIDRLPRHLSTSLVVTQIYSRPEWLRASVIRLARIIHTVILSAAKDLGGVSETGQILRCAQNDRRTALFMNNPG